MVVVVAVPLVVEEDRVVDDADDDTTLITSWGWCAILWGWCAECTAAGVRFPLLRLCGPSSSAFAISIVTVAAVDGGVEGCDDRLCPTVGSVDNDASSSTSDAAAANDDGAN